MYIVPTPQNTPRRSKPVYVIRNLFPDPMAILWRNSPNMLIPYDRFHQPSPTAFLYRLAQHVPFQKHAKLIFGALADATQHSIDNDVSIEMEWVNNSNDEELIRHMIAYEK